MATGGLRERKKQQTRELIAETARGLFSERGFEQVTVAEIARAANVSTQTVFNYFPTKEDLVYWRLESFEDELLTTLRERAPGETVLAAFGRFVRAPRGMLGDYDAQPLSTVYGYKEGWGALGPELADDLLRLMAPGGMQSESKSIEQGEGEKDDPRGVDTGD